MASGIGDRIAGNTGVGSGIHGRIIGTLGGGIAGDICIHCNSITAY